MDNLASGQQERMGKWVNFPRAAGHLAHQLRLRKPIAGLFNYPITKLPIYPILRYFGPCLSGRYSVYPIVSARQMHKNGCNLRVELKSISVVGMNMKKLFLLFGLCISMLALSAS